VDFSVRAIHPSARKENSCNLEYRGPFGSSRPLAMGERGTPLIQRLSGVYPRGVEPLASATPSGVRNSQAFASILKTAYNKVNH
jgi:hypothetical protein